MESLKELYKVGPGPSSSHTLAPQRACAMFKAEFSEAISFEVELYGSLSLTGKGHLTDAIIEKTFLPKPCLIYFKLNWTESFPNGLLIRGLGIRGEIIGEWKVFSLGGGSIHVVGRDDLKSKVVYPLSSITEIVNKLKTDKISLVDYIYQLEPDLPEHLNSILTVMLNSVQRGINATGLLPGKLEMPRIAKSMYLQAHAIEDEQEQMKMKLVSYAYATNEENASGGVVATAPTLGSCGVMAALMYYYYYDCKITRAKLCKALAVAGIFGNVIKKNATISGAVGGCQAEIGAACSMAAAAASYINDLNMSQIEYAAEIGIEHHLGLTCDPVGGYVIIPCIERNAVAVLRSLDAMTLAKYISKLKPNRISFDMVVQTMNYTGNKLAVELKETSLGGLAQVLIIEDETCDLGKNRQMSVNSVLQCEAKKSQVTLDKPLDLDQSDLNNDEQNTSIKLKL